MIQIAKLTPHYITFIVVVSLSKENVHLSIIVKEMGRMSGRKIVVAAAWPYVNGSLHLGHLTALLPGDVLARYHRAKGDDVLFVSGSDCHGTPILVTAERDGKTPAEIAQRYHEEAVEMLTRRIALSYSLYSKTMGEFHRQAAQLIFSEIYSKGYLVEREEEQTCGDDGEPASPTHR